MSNRLIREEKNKEAETPILAEEKQNLPGIDRRIVLILAIAGAFSVANLYYIQPLLSEITQSFSVSQSASGIVATLAQLGCATGLFLIIPLGDIFNRRRLIPVMLLAATVALLATAFAPSIPFLTLASFAVGVTTVVPQLIAPFGASLAHPQERGRVIGTITSGFLIGVLLSRPVGGFIGSLLGWRAMYGIAAAMMIVLALILLMLLPDEQPRTSMSYPRLLRTLWELIRTEPVLRETSILGGLIFGAFNVFWVTLAFFLETPPYHYGSEVVGLFGLVGVVSALSASSIGKFTDRIDARIITGVMLVITLVSFILFWLIGHMLWGLIIGVILLDVGTQGAFISNQARIFSLRPEARSRLNTVYMVTYFIGGSLGSLLSTYAWQVGHWGGVCIIGISMLAIALLVYVLGRRGKTIQGNHS